MTIDEMIAKWDAGEPVQSLEMGGIGPGYEQAIQILMMEILRDERDTDTTGDRSQYWADATVARCDKPCLGFSGSQVGAAKSLAWGFLEHGPDGFWDHLEKVAPERRKDMIFVSNKFPQAPAKGQAK